MLNITFDYNSITQYGTHQIQQGAFYGTSLNEIVIENCTDDINIAIDKLKTAFGFDINSNLNPLEVPEYCIIKIMDANNSVIGKYDYLFNNLLGSTIDINRNAIVFTDKSYKSIRPLLLIKQANHKHLPSIITNTFHANIVGRWK